MNRDSPSWLHSGTDFGEALTRLRERVGAVVREFSLALHGKFVITECATGPYALTGPMAAMAGAEGVLCLGSDSRTFGSFGEARDQTMKSAHQLGVVDRVSCVERDAIDGLTAVQWPTVITNLRGARPINGSVLRLASGPTVVCTMSEEWELRLQDVDIASCHRNGTPIVSTDEGHPALRSIELVGLLCLQIAATNCLPLANARIGVLGSGKFAAASAETLRKWNEIFCVTDHGVLEVLLTELDRFDYVVNADHDGAVLDSFTASLLVQRAREESVPIICLTGFPEGSDDDQQFVLPPRRAMPRHMTVALDALGPWPVLRLHAAGLHVGQHALDALTGDGDALDTCEFMETVITGS